MGPVVALVTVLALGGAATAADPGSDPAAVMDWNDVAVNAAVTVGKLSPPEATLRLAAVQAAVYDAVVAIEGGYQPYGDALTAQPGASVEAAVAAAAHDVLVDSFPDQQADLDTAYATALAAIPDGDAKTAGVSVGEAAAAATIADRADAGMGADVGFVMPAAAPGVWQLPPDQKPLAPWIAKLRPFMLTSADQFLPPPPPALTSPEWAADFDEIKTMGGLDSTARTPEQTEIAKFFSAQAAAQENAAIRKVVTDHGMDAVQAARLYAMMDLVGADALTACMNAKYQYLFWRPAFAVPEGDTDGNDATVGDPKWEPLLATPTHPEYPSNHGCFTAAEAKVLANVLGTDEIDFTLTSSVTADTLPSLTFATTKDYVDTVMNARTWGGLHYRTSDEAGATLGGEVADWTLARYFQPTS
jgi:hypothetical protein